MRSFGLTSIVAIAAVAAIIIFARKRLASADKDFPPIEFELQPCAGHRG